ncbi:MAG TPA: FecR family protein [Blastocatellia bacterium]|nr:FecR family protein [Blastocatellia bacterium]
MKPTLMISALAILIVSAGLVAAQDRKPLSPEEAQRFLVSAKAGAINVADGDVTVKKGQSDWQMVVVGDNLEDGQIVRTGSDSRAEVLLNPGSYLRINENSEFVFDSTDLNNLRIRLTHGSAIVEAAAVKFDGAKDSERRLMTVITPNQSFYISRSGVYRFDALPSGAQASVIKGKMNVDGKEIKEGKKALVDGTAFQVSDFSSDSFDDWSKDRAKSLVAANSTVTNPNVFQVNNTTFGLFGGGGFWGNPYYSCGGWWGFDPFLGSFLYVPSGFFGCDDFYSPYGYGYAAYGSPFRNYRPIVSPPARGHHHHGGTVVGHGVPNSTSPSKNGLGIAKGSNGLGVHRSGGFSGGHSFGGGGGGRIGGGGGGVVSAGGAARSSGSVSSGGHSSGGGHSH